MAFALSGAWRAVREALTDKLTVRADAPAAEAVPAVGGVPAPGAPAAAPAAAPAPQVTPVPQPKSWHEHDYLDLPCPVKYEDMQREVLMSLKPDLFEGVRFDFTKPLNQKFYLSHSVAMGNVEIPTGNPNQIVKIPQSTYEFGANLIDARYMLIGRMLTDGRMSGRMTYHFNDWVAMKLNAQVQNETGYSQGMFDLDFKGLDWNGQVKVGNNQFYGLNYLQSVTPAVALGGEAFWLGSQRKSGVGLAARYQTEKTVATAQVATTGLLSLTYAHKVSDKVSLVSDFTWNWNARDTSASVGYDYMLRQCRLRGRVDNNGVIAAYLEERLNVGVNFVVSAEVDHSRKDYKFGFGLTVGE